MRDAIGNKINEGNMLQWLVPSDVRAIQCKVIVAQDGGLSIPGEGKAVTPPILVVAFRMSMPQEQNRTGWEPTVPGAVRIVDPTSEQVLEGMGKAIKPS